MRDLLTTVLLLGLLLLFLVPGCGTINGLGSDTENVGRWIREVSQKSVDNMELRRIRSGIDTQNRIINRGTSLADATR